MPLIINILRYVLKSGNVPKLKLYEKINITFEIRLFPFFIPHPSSNTQQPKQPNNNDTPQFFIQHFSAAPLVKIFGPARGRQAGTSLPFGSSLLTWTSLF
jgi:hypothetical protein